jgi:hypothetical protein
MAWQNRMITRINGFYLLFRYNWRFVLQNGIKSIRTFIWPHFYGLVLRNEKTFTAKKTWLKKPYTWRHKNSWPKEKTSSVFFVYVNNLSRLVRDEGLLLLQFPFLGTLSHIQRLFQDNATQWHFLQFCGLKESNCIFPTGRIFLFIT